jgi:hypothetical protein
MVPTVEMACLDESARNLSVKLVFCSACLLAAFESIRGGGGMRPDCAGWSDLLLKVGPPKVAARLSFGETKEGGDSGETVEVGDIGSGTVVAKLISLCI